MAISIYILGCAISALLYIVISAVILAKSGSTDNEIQEFLTQELGAVVIVGLVATGLSWFAIFLYFAGFIGIYTYNKVKGKTNATTTKPSN